MPLNTSSTSNRKTGFFLFGLTALCLLAVLSILFHDSFVPGRILFSNDGPLGLIGSLARDATTNFKGSWQSLNWIGYEFITSPPNITDALFLLLGLVNFAKFYAAITLFIIGLCAWYFFRRQGFTAAACLIGALAASLNSDFFSTACWGVAAQIICFGMNFLALGLVSGNSSHRWIRFILAGLAVGMGVMEGFDIGAIFSVFTAAYVVFQSWNSQEKLPTIQKIGRGVGQVAIIAIFAAFISAQTLSTLVHTQIKGVAGLDQDPASKQKRWAEATQWSLPKAEVLQIIIPGFFGYRMDSPNGAFYWGQVGKNPMLDVIEEQAANAPDPQVRAQASAALRQVAKNYNAWRFSGGGIYAGVPVVVIAIWALFQSLCKKDSVFSLMQRRTIWFWTIAAFIALLLAFGRFAPFYQFVYDLPYASTIRNPAKFVHVVNWCIIIIFGYGLEGLFRTYVQNPVSLSTKSLSQFKNWYSKAPAFDKKWIKGSAVFLATALLAWLIYASCRTNLETYLQSVGIPASLVADVATFSLKAVGWSILSLLLTLIILALIFSGRFTNSRAKWAAVLLGLLLVADLGRANLPWIIHWNIKDKYASNPIIDLLDKKPYDHRVTGLFPDLPDPAAGMQSLLKNEYGIEWTQHTFLYYNVQSLDIVQMPRMGVDTLAYKEALRADPLRLWELTNTRYIIALAGLVDSINQQLDPVNKSFRLDTSFSLAPGAPGGPHKVMIETNGPFGLIEFTRALPRAQLYSNWQVITNDDATLHELTNPAWDPHQSVLLANDLPAPAAANTNAPAGTVQIKNNYGNKYVELDADVKVPSVLLLNDKYGPNWKATVDGKPEKILRANYIMRGLHLQPGHHTVIFRYEPPYQILYVSLSAIALGFVLIGILTVSRPKEEPAPVIQKEKSSAAKK